MEGAHAEFVRICIISVLCVQNDKGIFYVFAMLHPIMLFQL